MTHANPRRSRPTSESLPQPTDRSALGASGLSVSPLCIGIAGDAAIIPAAFDAGINFFFVTADMHWPLYRHTRRGLELLFERPGVRDQVVVAVVSYVTQPEFCVVPFDEVIDEIRGLERIDVAVIGGSYATDFFARYAVYSERLARAHVGMRAIGASFHERRAMIPAINRELLSVGFMRRNPGHSGADHDLLPHLSPSSGGLVYGFKNTSGYVPPERLDALKVPEGLWRPKITDYYRYALTPQTVDGVLVAPDDLAQLAHLVDALEEGPLEASEMHYLENLVRLDAGQARLKE